MKARSLLYLTLPIVLLAALYFVLKPQRAPESRQVLAETAATAPASVATAPAAAELRVPHPMPNTFDIVVQGGRRVSGPAILNVRQGEDVTIRISSDRAEELHLHGYNLHVHVTPEKTATLTFTAKLTGRFTYEFHRSGLELGALEVSPQ